MGFDVEAYAKQKGIPVGAITPDQIEKVQAMADAARKQPATTEGGKAEAFASLCNSTHAALEACAQKKEDNSKGPFPAACTDVGVEHMKCLVNKREQAFQTAVKLAGKEATEKAFPYYEDSKRKAMDLIELYQGNVAGDKLKKDSFWG